MKLRPLSVTEVNAYIKRNLSYDPILSNLIVEGELSNYKLHSSGHAYFTLKDDNAKISCVMFHNAATTVSFSPQDGMKLKAKGYISVYERDGKYQLYVKELEQCGIGDLHIEFEKLKKRLEEDGFFNALHKQDIPAVPESIAVITSPTGAAIRDILNVLKRRAPYVSVTIYPVHVQGETAGAEIADAIAKANIDKEYDAIIIGRGGGSIEELWAFNEEVVAHAVFESEIPIISGVGHETDYTISDFVSDLRAPTPSAAAELVAVSESELRGYLEAQKDKLVDSLKRTSKLSRERLEQVHPFKMADMLLRGFDERRYDLDMHKNRLFHSMASLLELRRQSLEYTGKMLDQVSPLKTLARGYSVTKNEADELVSSIRAVKPSDIVVTVLSDGEIKSQVLEVVKNREGRNA